MGHAMYTVTAWLLLCVSTVHAAVPAVGYVMIEKYGTLWDKDESCTGEKEWCGDTLADGGECKVMGSECTTSNCKYGIKATMANNVVNAQMCLDAYCSDRCVDWTWTCDTCECGLFASYSNDG